MNEIHGAWFDPSNPVVPFSGSLRSDLFQEMLQAEKQTDLCLCLGTSLAGMNADRMAKTPAEKSLKNPKETLGTVIINLQETNLDHQSAVRVWAKLDDAMDLLARELQLTLSWEPFPPLLHDQFVLGYDNTGFAVWARKQR